MTQSEASARHALPPQPASSRSTSMRVLLAFEKQRVNVWLRFGRPARDTVLDPWHRVAAFAPGAICCRVKWVGNDYGTVLWQLIVLQAVLSTDDVQCIAGVDPGARLLLRADGEREVKPVLEIIDAIEASGIDLCETPSTFWRTVGNRLAARQPLPQYTAERHAATLANEALR